ncbi:MULTISPECIES: glycoside hydrolase family 3 N-terminal domain-containing protein [Nocardiaceae]|uniref:beta-N-acetylhexosaminidase n=1 Tax=Rhodococcoides kroppenstedtii TaxID=293050 RepID=A0ABS7NTU0_9NOCA|nr:MULTISPECIES: glycoside hydrolase family 3 N-terminal domain-containing protein [Rhodococcus]AMY17472.1 Beta-hexosaminidase A [Rhodococcus sp. PBTS 1]MBY6312813.1 glycoside hydrolase family 3 protein [Rhodococcus kroppenstedtii]MBY6321023.1 glycoside hydrolase family 3 protein [Rhodococcus kroppenstedtii]MBY6399570.1 glycoside hydrolase family 3 protein [Rhodococcus kroppenstedtii]
MPGYRLTCLLAVSTVALAACGSGSQSDAPEAPAPSPAAASESAGPTSSAVSSGSAAAPPATTDSCAQAVAALTERQRLAQLLTVGVTGTDDALAVVRAEQVGGVFVGSWTEPSMLAGGGVAQVQEAASIPVMVTIDEEGGRVSRAEDLLGSIPSARETAATMTPEQTYAMWRERGEGLRNLGITVDFAPDVDVSAQADDTVIGDRSYSDDPATVVAYADAAARGLRDAGVLPVIKHFPGHGAASGDSHTGAVTTPPLGDLQTRDLVPFRELARPGVGAMVGHLDVPGLTAPGEPASISPAAMALLRDGTGYGAAPFDGPIFTDDLSGMAAITSRLGIEEAVEAALVAGADVALWITTDAVPDVLDRLEDAVATGRLTDAQVNEKVATVLRAKAAPGCV